MKSIICAPAVFAISGAVASNGALSSLSEAAVLEDDAGLSLLQLRAASVDVTSVDPASPQTLFSNRDADVALFVHHTAAKRHVSKSKSEEASFSAWDTAPPAKDAKFEELAGLCSADMEWLQPGEYDSMTFRCLAGACVPIQGRCNGFYNCGDGSDELHCPKRHPEKHFNAISTACTGLQLSIEPGSSDEVTFRCLGGSCVPMEARCNGFANCGDESDELECHNNTYAKDSHQHGHKGSHEDSRRGDRHAGLKRTTGQKGRKRVHRLMSRTSAESAILTSTFGDNDSESEASTAELSEEGYQALVASGDTEDMGVFARRVIAQEGLEIVDEGSLSGMLPYYSGKCKVQSYADLVEEVHGATMANKCHGQWTRVAPPPAPLPVADEIATDPAPSEQAPAASAQSANDAIGPIDGVNLASGLHRMASASQERAFAWRAAQTDVLGYVQQKDLADGLPHVGETASLDNHGYHQVRAERSSLEMGLFIRRVLKKHGLVADETALQYCVPWHSGECESKSYSFLIKELHDGITRPAHCGGPWVERVHKKVARN